MNRPHVGDMQFLDERQADDLDYEYLQIHLSESTMSFATTHFDGFVCICNHWLTNR